MIYFHHSSYNSHKLCPNPIFSYKRRVSYINNKIITTFACYIKKEPYEQKIYYTMYLLCMDVYIVLRTNRSPIYSRSGVIEQHDKFYLSRP